MVLDGEVVVLTADGRADFELLSARIHGRRQHPDRHPATFFVFDVLQLADQDLTDQPWQIRRPILDDLDLSARSGGAAGLTFWTVEGEAVHQATRAIRAEGTVSKRSDSIYRPDRSRQWLKAKHSTTETFQVAGWRPSTTSRPGGLILAEHDDPIAMATLVLADRDRAALVDLLHRYGRQHPTGTITIPADRLTATVRYTSRTPTHGHLREAFVLAVQPAGEASRFRPSVSQTETIR